MKKLITKIKQFRCKHEDDDIIVGFSLAPPRILLMPVWGKKVDYMTISCGRCGKRLGGFRLHGKSYNSEVDNKIYDIYKVDYKGSEIARKSHSLSMIKTMVRTGLVTGEQVRALLKAEKK